MRESLVTSTAQSRSAGLCPLPAGYQPDWEHVRTALLRLGEPEWVPFLEGEIDPVHMARVIGRPVRSLSDYLAITTRLGQPFMAAEVGLQTEAAVRIAIGAAPAGLGLMGEVGRSLALGKKGVIGSMADLEAFPWPDPDRADLSGLAERERMLPGNSRIILVMGKVFDLAWWLMGLEGYAYALVDQPALVAALHQKIAGFQERLLARALDFKSVGMVFHADDVAYRTGLIVSPAVLRRHVLPVYRRMNALCRQRDVITVFHSDGKVDTLVEDIIEIGFDALHPVEPTGMDIRALKQRAAGRLSLIGNVDLAYTLTRGTPAEVEREVRDLIHDLAPGGGYALSSANSIPDYVPWENFAALYGAWCKYGQLTGARAT